MSDLILTTYDWVPEPPRGYVRDLQGALGTGRGWLCLSGRKHIVSRSRALPIWRRSLLARSLG